MTKRRRRTCILLTLLLLGGIAVFHPAPAGGTHETRNLVPSGDRGLGDPWKGSEDLHPLEPLDRSSPRATMTSFLEAMEKAHGAQQSHGPKSYPSMLWIRRAVTCLDTGKIPHALVQSLGPELAIQLKETFDRIELPPPGEIPDASEMLSRRKTVWTVPHTEIHLVEIQEGPGKSAYVFSPDSVALIPEFYRRTLHLPYRPGAAKGFYEDYIYAPGWMLPHRWIDRLPAWANTPYLDQTLWQWAALLLLSLLGILCMLRLHRWHRRRFSREVPEGPRWQFHRLLVPLCGMAVALSSSYLLDEQINITGGVLEIASFVMDLVWFGYAGLLIVAIGNLLIAAILASPGLGPTSIDANLIRLVLRVATLLGLFGLFWHTAEDFGFPVTAVFASAGVAGVALAFAAKDTIANFFGGLTLLMDRPFKTGDYIILNSGERGKVQEIGLRSTRILTRDDVMICIPNAVITEGKIINESAPKPHFRVRIAVGVAYGTDIARVEELLVELAKTSPLSAPSPEPRARLRSLGDSSLQYELLCWAKNPGDKGLLVHELNKAIYTRFTEEGISFPFPQRDVRLSYTCPPGPPPAPQAQG